jgi:hypothetical protein
MKKLERLMTEAFNEDNQIIADLRQQLAEVTKERDMLKVYIACIRQGEEPTDGDVLWLPRVVHVGTSTFAPGWVDVRGYPELKQYCDPPPRRAG